MTTLTPLTTTVQTAHRPLFRTHYLQKPLSATDNAVCFGTQASKPARPSAVTRIGGGLLLGLAAAFLSGCSQKPETTPTLELRIDETTIPNLNDAKGWYIPGQFKQTYVFGPNRSVELDIRGTLCTSSIPADINKQLDGKKIQDKSWQPEYMAEIQEKLLQPIIQQQLDELYKTHPTPDQLDRFDIAKALGKYLHDQTDRFLAKQGDGKLYHSGLQGLRVDDIQIHAAP